MLSGTSTKNAIQGFGGFNVSEYNIQRHRPKEFTNSNTEADHQHKQYSGRNPLNNPGATDAQRSQIGANTAFNWRERTLPGSVPGQVAGSFGRLPYTSADTSLLQWKLHHGLGANDPSLRGMIDERNVAPSVRANWNWQSDPFLHSDIGVPSVVNQNMMEKPTQNIYPFTKRGILRGKHDHVNLEHHTRPIYWNDSNTSTGTHHTHGGPPHPMVEGFRATRGPLERPLLLSDLPQPPEPVAIY